MKDVADVPFLQIRSEDMSIIIGHLKPRFLHKGDIVYTRGILLNQCTLFAVDL